MEKIAEEYAKIPQQNRRTTPMQKTLNKIKIYKK